MYIYIYVMDYIIVFFYFPRCDTFLLPIATFVSKHGEVHFCVYVVAAPNHNAKSLDNVMS